MKKYSTFKIMAGLFAISLSGLLSGCGSTNNLDLQPAMEVQAASGAAQNRITVRGTVESTERRNIYSTLSLFVDQIHVQEGDQITKGHVLAALDSEDLQLTIAQQRASLESARQNSQNTVSETQRMLDEATANLANNRNIHILSAEAALSAA
ncbi:MAG: efflux RND transporter periplasmic adaptor subunit, partial [Defluviitaleaceae bacterium]|nr:efflux RND transporter periplasmic adaptor subunit [Defluviitaleaceae bacterium]